MAVTSYSTGAKFVPIRSGQVCPVCGSKKGRCSEFYNEEGIKVFYRCKNAASNRPSDGWYIHLVKDIDGYDPNQKDKSSIPRLISNPVMDEEITEEVLQLRDKVYRRFRELVKKYEGSYLYPQDNEDLLKRGLTEKQIEIMGFFSVPTSDKMVWSSDGDYQMKVSTAISRDLEKEFGNKLLRVAGFVKLRDKKSNEFITFKSRVKDPVKNRYIPIKGYFVPYIDRQGWMVGLQYRLTEPLYDEKGKLMRYFWYSSSQARSGSPIDVYIPSSVNPFMTNVRLVTEGALKGKIASEYLGVEVYAEAGVDNYRALVSELTAQEEIEGVKFNIILALDMDKVDNKDVLRAEKSTIALFKGTGHQVAIPAWDGSKAKGIDDALRLGLRITYRLI